MVSGSLTVVAEVLTVVGEPSTFVAASVTVVSDAPEPISPPPRVRVVGRPMERRIAAKGLVSVVVSVVFVVVLSMPLGILPPLGGLANPRGGTWAGAGEAGAPTGP